MNPSNKQLPALIDNKKEIRLTTPYGEDTFSIIENVYKPLFALYELITGKHYTIGDVLDEIDKSKNK